MWCTTNCQQYILSNLVVYPCSGKCDIKNFVVDLSFIFSNSDAKYVIFSFLFCLEINLVIYDHNFVQAASIQWHQSGCLQC